MGHHKCNDCNSSHFWIHVARMLHCWTMIGIIWKFYISECRKQRHSVNREYQCVNLFRDTFHQTLLWHLWPWKHHFLNWPFTEPLPPTAIHNGRPVKLWMSTHQRGVHRSVKRSLEGHVFCFAFLKPKTQQQKCKECRHLNSVFICSKLPYFVGLHYILKGPIQDWDTFTVQYSVNMWKPVLDATRAQCNVSGYFLIWGKI